MSTLRERCEKLHLDLRVNATTRQASPSDLILAFVEAELAQVSLTRSNPDQAELTAPGNLAIQQLQQRLKARVARQFNIEHGERRRQSDALPTHVEHRKRGSTYKVIGPGFVQAEIPLMDLDEVVIYQSLSDDTYWVRAPDEFEDGRYVSLDPKISFAPPK